MVAGRYLCRIVGQSTDAGPWDGYTCLNAMNCRVGHDRVVSEWNRRDRGGRIWRWVEILEGDFDYKPLAGERKAE